MVPECVSSLWLIIEIFNPVDRKRRLPLYHQSAPSSLPLCYGRSAGSRAVLRRHAGRRTGVVPQHAPYEGEATASFVETRSNKLLLQPISAGCPCSILRWVGPVMAWCEANGVDFLFGLARNERLEQAIKTD